MSSDIRIRKGLDIQLKGKADAITKPAPLAAVYGIKPAEFHRVIPKLIAREGATLKAGDAVFYDKRDERVLFPSPVSGTITENSGNQNYSRCYSVFPGFWKEGGKLTLTRANQGTLA